MYQNLTTVDKFHQPSLELLFSSKTEGNMDDILFHCHRSCEGHMILNHTAIQVSNDPLYSFLLFRLLLAKYDGKREVQKLEVMVFLARNG